MAHPDIAASMARSMKIEATQQKSAESATTADEGAAEASGSEETSEESSTEEGGEEGADSTTDGDNAGGEGNEDGSESGSQDAESDDTTAEGEESDAASEERASGEEDDEDEDNESSDEKSKAPKWDEEEQKAVKDWFGKEADKVKPDPVTKKLLKIARDNQTKAQESTQAVASLNNHIAGLGELIVNQDFEGINSIAEELGGKKLPFDTRTHEDRMKEMADSYNSVFDTLQAALKDKPDTWELVQRALDPYYQKTAAAIGKLKEESLLNRAEEAGRREAGKPVKGSISKDLEKKATQNFTDLKSKDKEAQDRFDALKPYFQGGILRDKNRIYGLTPQLADQLGKAVEFHANFEKKYLPKIRESIKGEEKARKALKAPPSSRKPEGERPGGKAPANSNQKKFDTFAGPKILERLRG